MKLGDVISSVATPIARGLGLPCVDPTTGQLRPESGCAKRRNWLNDLSDTAYDYLFKHKQNGATKMQFIVTRQIAVEAETPEEAVAKLAEGNTISLSVNPRPQPVTQPIRPAPPQPR